MEIGLLDESGMKVTVSLLQAAVTLIAMLFMCWISENYVKREKRDIFLGIFFGVGLAIATTFLCTKEVTAMADVFVAFSTPTKCAFGIFLASSVYFLMRTTQCLCSSEDKKLGRGKKPSGSSKNATTVEAHLPKITYPKDLDWNDNLKGSFLVVCDFLIEELLDDLKNNYEAIPEQIQWVKDMLQYNVKGGKMNRGMGVIDVQQVFAKHSEVELDNDEFCRAAVLGCCIEWLQAFFLVADDVMDDSLTRRGQPCWYKLPHVKQIAINDSFILESMVYRVLQRHFSCESYYLQLLELFHDVTYRTEMGQLLDLTSQPLDAPSDFSRFTAVRYSMIVKYKTAFYTFYLPCAIGMVYAGVTDARSFELAKRICCVIGEYFQIQDDYLDCFGDPAVIGKIGTDIQDKKCSWLVVRALDKCSEAQKKELVDNYGKNEKDKIDKVKTLYKELNLPSDFAAYEESSYQTIHQLISKVTDVPKDVYLNFIKRIYKRNK